MIVLKYTGTIKQLQDRGFEHYKDEEEENYFFESKDIFKSTLYVALDEENYISLVTNNCDVEETGLLEVLYDLIVGGLVTKVEVSDE